VEARDLKEGDVLKEKGGEGLTVTRLSSRQARAEVYNLEVEGYHNYAIHRRGILVHNKGGAEKGPASEISSTTVKVFGKVMLEHYEASILGAASASALLSWLQDNGYQVDNAAQRVLAAYIERGWAFVAVKLNPIERRHYENGLLPALTIRYWHDKLTFPLRISSISTTGIAKVTLYVIAESTVSSSNLPTTPLRYRKHIPDNVDPESYIAACIRNTMATVGRGLVVLWSGEFVSSVDQRNILGGLIETPFTDGKKSYLTRLETRMDPATMTEDIEFTYDKAPKEFWVLLAGEGYDDSVNLESLALILASQAGETKKVQKLLRAGAGVNDKDQRGRTAMGSAVNGGHVEIVRILLASGADVNAWHQGWSALVRAVYQGRSEITRILLEAGADVNVLDGSGFTALTAAASTGQTDLARKLLDAGANINSMDSGGRTALIWAVVGGHTEFVRILLAAGADVQAGDKGGSTSLMLAEQHGYIEIVDLLRKAGARK